MLDKETYEKLIRSLKENGRVNSIEHLAEYLDYTRAYSDFNDLCPGINNQSNEHDANTELAILFIIRWGIQSLAVAEKGRLRFIYKCMLLTISNTSLAILKLALSGLDYQTSVLQRTLYELCFTFLNMLIDGKKRKRFLETPENNDDIKVWRDCFSIKQLNATLVEYERKFSGGDRDLFTQNWRKQNYMHYSSHVHHEFHALTTHSFSKPKGDDDVMDFILWGNSNSRYSSIISQMNELLWYTELLYLRIMTDEDTELDIETFRSEETVELSDLATSFGLIAQEYFMHLKIEKEGFPEL